MLRNLTNQFRTVAMVVPDRGLILKVKLAPSGFSKCDALSDQFASLSQLCGEHHSKHLRYDWVFETFIQCFDFEKNFVHQILAGVSINFE
jgi:hypothetical protein